MFWQAASDLRLKYLVNIFYTDAQSPATTPANSYQANIFTEAVPSGSNACTDPAALGNPFPVSSCAKFTEYFINYLEAEESVFITGNPRPDVSATPSPSNTRAIN
jgi:hypothetical protein